jgi:diguanylate cyclase (GGDEF)-like protein
MRPATSAAQQRIAGRYQKAQLLLLVSVVALAGVAVYLAYTTRDQIWSGAHRSLRSLAIALENASTALLDQSGASIAVIHADLPAEAASAVAVAELRSVMRLDPVSEYLGIIPPSRETITAVDHAGVPVKEAVIRELLAQLPRERPGFQVAPPLRIGPNRDAFLPLILTPEPGQNPTVTFALVPAKRLIGSPEELSLVPDSSVLFVAEDGRRLFLYAAGHFDEKFTGRSSAEVMRQATSRPNGSIEFVPPYNGVRAVLGWAHSRHFPFYVGAFVYSSSLREAWLRRVALPVGILLLALIAVGVFAAQLNHALKSQRVYAEKQEYLAAHDTLTGLMNRSAFLNAVGTQLTSHPEAALGMFVLDLNRFKDINDSLGHAAGDHVLQELSRRLKSHLDSRTVAARLGEDELAIARPLDQASQEPAAPVIATIQSAVADPIRLLGVTLEVSATIGIALYPTDANNASDLLRCADIARSTAKTELRPVATYAESTDRSAPERLALLGDFARALRDGHIRLVYQPKVQLSDRRVCGLEALARWNHPKLGPVPPSSFVAIAETTELIHPFTQYVIDQALSQSAKWSAMGVRLPISVNVSANNLLDAGFVERLAQLLRRHQVPGELLEVEITESAVLRHPETILRRLNEIRELGVQLAIDDFGTGYASLAYLKRLPVQSLKIDKAFILNLLGDPADQRIVRSAIQLAHGFGLSVVAEGVESAEVAERLLAEGSDYGQGYHLGRPQEAAEIERTTLFTQAGSPSPDLA